MRACGMHGNTYHRWRTQEAWFHAEAEKAKVYARDELKAVVMPSTTGTDASIAFRKRYFGHNSSSAHVQIIKAVRECPPGKVVIVTVPPGGGKTTCMEDLACEDIAKNPNFRGAHVHASKGKSGESLKKIKRRMEPDGPSKNFFATFGPFKPKTDTSKPWAAFEFTVEKSTHDEKDPTWQAKSWTSSIQGSRLDLMLVDDVQSMKSLSQTNRICDTLQQDFFTRDAQEGMKIVLVNTRVGEKDVPSVMAKRLSETGALHKWIVVPAFNKAGDSYDPELWPVEKLMAKKALVPDEIWQLCFMQDPKQLRVLTFPETLLESRKNRARGVGQQSSEGMKRVASVDPALGGANVITVSAWNATRFEPIFQQCDRGLGRMEQIISVIQATHATHWFTDLIIEENAFQRGLAHDERLASWAAERGVTVIPHLTGWGKLDDTMGVASMAGALTQNQMDFPWKGDAEQMFAPLLDEMSGWRPDQKSRERIQDRVMSLWFGYLHWMKHREDFGETNYEDWDAGGMSWTPTGYAWKQTETGLLVRR